MRSTPESAVDDKGDVAAGAAAQSLVAKEHFVFTDPEGQLYHFSVEGNNIRDGTKIAPEHGLGTLGSQVFLAKNVFPSDFHVMFDFSFL